MIIYTISNVISKMYKNQKHLKYTMSRTDLHKCTTFNIVKQLNLIGEIK